VELDPGLAGRARANLAPWPWVEVIAADGAALDPGPRDALFVTAGATHPERGWLDALRPGGRLLVPLTAPLPGFGSAGAGWMLRVVRRGDAIEARFVSPVGIFHCAGARRSDEADALARAFLGGGQQAVRSLRRDVHRPDDGCWLHGDGFCLSTRDGS
jgi:protein-L-isoaspartate(D-aspartate) O-methyltransferase